MLQVADQQHLFTCKQAAVFLPGEQCLSFTHRALPQAGKLGNCSSLAVVFSTTGISCEHVAMQSWCLLGFSSSSVPSSSFEHGEELAVDRNQSRCVWERRDRFASDFSMVRTKMDSAVLVTGFCFGLCSFTVFPRLVLCNFFVERGLWVSFSSLPISTENLWIHKEMWTEHQNEHS